jgi:hypothetical protein
MSGIHLALLGMTYGGGVTVIQSFTATGEWVCPTGVTKVEWLIVAGGGGGGGNVAGGGGAGGFRTGTGLSVTAGTTYTITVGAGGPGSVLNADRGTNGFDSSIAGAPITENPSGAGTNTLKAYGGGGGGTYDGVGTGDGISGGSGGGGGSKQAAGTTPGGSGNTPNTSPSQGNDGGTGLYFPFGDLYPAGGGGGATDPGGAATSSAPGNGGNGTASAISGVSPSPSYAGGGGGARGEGGWRHRRLWHCHPKIPCTSRNHSHAYLQRIGVLGCTYRGDCCGLPSGCGGRCGW